MSVIFFGPDELANVAHAAVAATGHTGNADGAEAKQRWVERLARISVANAEAYNATYSSGKVKHWTPADILANYTLYPAKFKLALDTIDGIRYNLVSNGGKDFATFEILDDLLAAYKHIAHIVLTLPR